MNQIHARARRAEPFIAEFERLDAVGAEGTCTGSTMDWMNPTPIADTPYVLYADVLVA